MQYLRLTGRDSNKI